MFEITSLQIFTIALIAVCPGSVKPSCVYHDYCVVGAGPGGLQIGYFLQTACRDYVVFERSNTSGNFFELYPRHRKLISINKRHTGQRNAEFNLRHDWNSLLSHDEDLRVTKYSKDMFPDASVLLKYLRDYQDKLQINVQFNTKVENIRQVANDSAPDKVTNTMEDQRGQCYTCRTLIMANGVSIPHMVKMKGIELAEGYETVSINPNDYEGKAVLILGRGNSAFELADSILGSTSFIHLVSRTRQRLAWSTHYVGDLRAINNGLLDTYQLKSLDGLAEIPLDEYSLVKVGDKLQLQPLGEENPNIPNVIDNDSNRVLYDVAVRSLGFIYDQSVFNITSKVFWSKRRHNASKYPKIHNNYESKMNKGMFFAGTASHSLDFRKSAGGFIHGFRYTARSLHRLLEWRYEGVPWPSVTIPRGQLLYKIIKRLNEASGTYQMFQFLGDVVIFSKDGSKATYIEEFPIKLLHDLTRKTSIEAGPAIAIVLEYGKNFSGPGKDVFEDMRALGEPSEAINSNFLHPVMYFYKELPTARMMSLLKSKDILPKPDALHAIVEDFLTDWTAQHSHLLPLRRFLENVLDTDLRHFRGETCFTIAMSTSSLPDNCDTEYLAGRSLSATELEISMSQLLETTGS